MRDSVILVIEQTEILSYLNYYGVFVRGREYKEEREGNKYFINLESFLEIKKEFININKKSREGLKS